VNRVTPAPPAGLASLRRAELSAAAGRLDKGGAEQQAVAALLRLHADRMDVARRQRKDVAAALHGIDPRVLVEVPLMPSDVHDLADLDLIGAHLYGEEQTGAA
jgi:hypothetical protein